MNSLAAIEGWYHLDTEKPQLIGSCCTKCGTYYFPKSVAFCKNPHCQSTSFDEVALSTTGVVWSYTDACYQPPEPYVSADPYEPFAIAAVQLEKEKIIVLGQVAKGYCVDDLTVGQTMELVLETLHVTEDNQEKLVWKWKPIDPQQGNRA